MRLRVKEDKEPGGSVSRGASATPSRAIEPESQRVRGATTTPSASRRSLLIEPRRWREMTEVERMRARMRQFGRVQYYGIGKAAEERRGLRHTQQYGKNRGADSREKSAGSDRRVGGCPRGSKAPGGNPGIKPSPGRYPRGRFAATASCSRRIRAALRTYVHLQHTSSHRLLSRRQHPDGQHGEETIADDVHHGTGRPHQEQVR